MEEAGTQRTREEGENVHELRERVAAAARRLAEERLVIGTAGNVSARTGDTVAITPTGAVLETVAAEEIALVDINGEQREGTLEPSSELALHLGVYARYGAGAVVHTHSPMATALSCVIDELPVVHYQMLVLGGSIRVAPYATFGTPELADATLEALRDRTAALMASHGAINYAHDLGVAVEHALLLEWSCSVYWHARAIGEPRTMDAAEMQAVVEAAVSRRYGSERKGRG